MDRKLIRGKFGDDYDATERTFKMGIDRRLADKLAERFSAATVLETCTGGGFCTIALARVAEKVVTLEIDPDHQDQARRNVARAGLLHKVAFLRGDALNRSVLASRAPFDAAFLDPDWAVTGPGHEYRFRGSNTEPPADELLEVILDFTPDVCLVLPPYVDPSEFDGLPPHERQEVYLEGRHELTCLFFGALARTHGVSECREGE